MKLKTKFLAVSAASAIIIMGSIALSRWAHHENSLLMERQTTISLVTQRHMDSDMMHDAIRSDVLSAILAMHNGDTLALEQAKEDIATHGQRLADNFSTNQKEQMPKEIADNYRNALEAMNDYIAGGKKVIETIQAGSDYHLEFKRFSEKFATLEGGMEDITKSIDAWAEKERWEGAATMKRISILSLFAGVLSVLAVVALPLMAVLLLFRPQQRLIQVMDGLARGDYSMAVEGTQRGDEMGDIARAVEIFKNNGIERLALENKQAEANRAAEAEARKRDERAAATEAFAERMRGIIQTVAAAATQLYQTSERMGVTISGASERLNTVTSASSETSHSVQSVAAAAEELSATVREIAQQITRSNDNIRNAVVQVGEADDTAISLGQATEQIGQIIDVIQSIANQINLLALNATIESARAGEAGKGFAVVAGEVKTLATQTSQATDEIAKNITSIQTVSQRVIETLRSIKSAIASVEEVSTAISAAVEEQNVTTNDIASNMGTAARGTAQIDEEIREVNSATNESSHSATQVLDAAKMLSQQAESLQEEVMSFITKMKAA